MKKIVIIGILVFLLAMVNLASASTFYLTETDSGDNYGVPIKVQVDYTENNMQIRVLEPQNKAYDNLTVSNVDLTNIQIKTSSDRIISVSAPWAISDTKGDTGYFGFFRTQITNIDSSRKSAGPVDIKFADNVNKLIQRSGGYFVVAQISFQKLGKETGVVDSKNNTPQVVHNVTTVQLKDKLIETISNSVTFGLLKTKNAKEDVIVELKKSEESEESENGITVEINDNSEAIGDYQTAPADNKNISPADNKNTAPTGNSNTAPTDNNTTAPTDNNTTAPTGNNNTAPTSNNNTASTDNNNTAPTGNNNTVPTDNNTTAPMDNNNTAPTDNNNTAPTGNNNTVPTDNNTAPTDNNTTAPTGNNTTAPTDNNNTVPTENNTTAPTDNNNTVPTENNTTAPTDNNNTVPTDNNNTGATNSNNNTEIEVGVTAEINA